jgi:hypothetical protein
MNASKTRRAPGRAECVKNMTRPSTKLRATLY